MSRDEKIGAAEAAQALGLELRRRRWAPCPACGAQRDSTGRGVVVCHGPRWFCSKCDARGDGVNLISYALTGEPRSYRAAFRWLEERGTVAPAVQPIEEPEKARIPASALASLLRASQPARESRAPDYLEHCERKGVDPTAAPGGILPPPGHPVYALTRDWWPQAWSRTWRIVLPMFDHQGKLAGMHVRATDPTAKPKARWPLGVDCRGLFFADGAGRALLRRDARPSEVLVAEGFSDSFYAMSLPVRPGRATLGVESGSAERLSLVPFTTETAVYIATHPDTKGDLYAEKAQRAVLPAMSYRLPMMRA